MATLEYSKNFDMMLDMTLDLSQCGVHTITQGYMTLDIVACQRGGVSNKPPWAPGSVKTGGDPLVRSQVD